MLDGQPVQLNDPLHDRLMTRKTSTVRNAGNRSGTGRRKAQTHPEDHVIGVFQASHRAGLDVTAHTGDFRMRALGSLLRETRRLVALCAAGECRRRGAEQEHTQDHQASKRPHNDAYDS